MLRPAATATRLRSSAVIAFVALALAAGGCAQSSSSGNGNAGGGNTKGGGRQDVAALQDVNRREAVFLVLLAVAVLWMGLHPRPLADLMNPTLQELLQHVMQKKVAG